MKPPYLLLFLCVAIFFLWPTPLLYPLKLLVVFFHESSHALMTVATGGTVIELIINPMQGGHVLSSGGNRFLTLTAGYLGSMLWGVLIYLLAVTSQYDKALMFTLGIIITSIALFFVRTPFALIFCSLTGLTMLAIGTKASMKINDFILRLIGLTNLLYVPLDIYSDTISRSFLRSDAYMLAEEFGGSTLLWGLIWLLTSIVILYFTLKLSLTLSSTNNNDNH